MTSFSKKLIIQLAVLFLIIVVGVGGLIFFGVNIKIYSKKLIDARQEMVNRYSSLNSLAILKSQYNTLVKDELEKLKGVLPSRNEVLDISKKIQDVAAKNKLSFGFTFGKEIPSTATTPPAISFNLNIKGLPNQVDSFLQELNKLKPTIVVDNLTLNRQNDNQQIDIQGRLFFLEK